jgi:hypothetical protein
LEEAKKEAEALKNTSLEQLQKQENADRDYELRKEELKLKEEKQSSISGEEGIELSKDPYEYLQEIVKQNTSYHQAGGYKEIDKKAIKTALNQMVHDEKLSLRYRYEMYLYAKSLGYLP